MNLTPAPLPPIVSQVAPPVLLLPRPDQFTRRARRLHQLSAGHTLGDWLAALSGLCEAQALLDTPGSTPLWQPPPASALGALQGAAGRARLMDRLDEELDRLLTALAGTAGAVLTQDLTRPVRGDLTHRAGRLLDWASGTSDQPPHERLDVLLAAVLQVRAAQALRGLNVPSALSPLAGPQTCPCCGSAAHAGLVLIADGKAGLRYLECSLCGSRWHAVRARCTLCDDPHEVSYHGLEGAHPGVLAETCDGCLGYIKTLFADKDPGVEPLADDLATLALDVLVGEAGHSRAAPQLFLLAGDLGA